MIAFALAAVLAGLVTYYFNLKVRASNVRHSLIQVVAAADELPAGIPLTSKDLKLVEWPSSLPLTGSFSKTEEVVGRPLLHSVGAKEPILQRDLGAEGSGIGLAGKIPAGMRAFSVKSNEIVGVAGFLYPGSHVDVLCTYNVPGTSSGPITQTVLQDVEVITAGQTIEPDPKGKPETVNVVTLLLAPEDAQKLQLATSQGSIQFVLRSGVDQKSVQLHPTRLDQLAGVEKPPAPAPMPKVARRIAPAKSVFVVEVIEGTKRKEEKF